MTAEITIFYKNASTELLRDLRVAAKDCSAFAVMTPKGPELTQWINVLDDHDPRTQAWRRLQWLHLKASGTCEEY